MTPPAFRRQHVGPLEIGVVSETMFSGRPLAFPKVAVWVPGSWGDPPTLVPLTPEEAEAMARALRDAAVWARNTSTGRVAVDLAEARRRAAEWADEYVEAQL